MHPCSWSGVRGNDCNRRSQQVDHFVIASAHIGEKMQTFDCLVERHHMPLLDSQLPGVPHVLKVSRDGV